MKKLITLIALVGATITAQAAPKVIHLGFNLVSPANNGTITAGTTPFNQDVVITVLGPDVVAAADTLFFIDPTAPSGSAYISFGRTKGINDTIHLVKSLTVAATTPNGTYNYCVAGYMQNGTTITVDSIYGKCNSITITGGATGLPNLQVSEFVAKTALNFAPNPANNEINIEYSANNKGAVVATVFDITGRQVYSYNYGSTGASTYKLDISKLTPGMYIVEMTQENNTRAIGKLNKQ